MLIANNSKSGKFYQITNKIHVLYVGLNSLFIIAFPFLPLSLSLFRSSFLRELAIIINYTVSNLNNKFFPFHRKSDNERLNASRTHIRKTTKQNFNPIDYPSLTCKWKIFTGIPVINNGVCKVYIIEPETSC